MDDLLADPARPAPQPTELGAPFWEAARRRQLVRPVCDACGTSWFTPQLACPACLSETWSWRPSSGRGRIHAFTVVHRAPTPGFATPYVLADVDVEEGWHLLTNIVGCAPDEVRIDQAVVVAWLEVAGGAVLPVFRPAEQAADPPGHAPERSAR